MSFLANRIEKKNPNKLIFEFKNIILQENFMINIHFHSNNPFSSCNSNTILHFSAN